MKKILLFIFIVLTCTVSLIAQTKQVAEIDKLANKYKDVESITLFTSHGDLTGNIYIDSNINQKPQSVRILGESINKEAIAEFLSGVLSQKKNQGYKPSNGDDSPIYADEIVISLGFENVLNITLKKGSMYFICKGGLVMNYSSSDDSYWFTIETGDNSRKGGSKATNFEF